MTSEAITLLGEGRGCALIHQPTSGIFLVEKRGATVLRGVITKNRFGLDTLPFERLDKESGDGKTAHAYLDGDRLIVPACNLIIPVNPALPALARLTNSRRRAQSVLRRSYEALKERALRSKIVCRVGYQLTTAYMLLEECTGEFTLAWINLLDPQYPRWHFAPGDVHQGVKNQFVRFLELNESGNATLRASAYPRGEDMMLEFEFQQPIACKMKGATSPHIEALRLGS